MDNNVFLNDDFSNKDTKKDSTDLNKADRLTKLEKSIAAVYEAVFEIDVNKNSVYNVFIKKNTNLYNEFSCNKMSYRYRNSGQFRRRKNDRLFKSC